MPLGTILQKSIAQSFGCLLYKNGGAVKIHCVIINHNRPAHRAGRHAKWTYTVGKPLQCKPTIFGPTTLSSNSPVQIENRMSPSGTSQLWTAGSGPQREISSTRKNLLLLLIKSENVFFFQTFVRKQSYSNFLRATMWKKKVARFQCTCRTPVLQVDL